MRRREAELQEREPEEKAHRSAAETELIKREVQAALVAERAREQQVSEQKSRAERDQQATEENEQKEQDARLRESATKAAKNDLSLETSSLRSETASDNGTTITPSDPGLSMEVSPESQSDEGSVAAKEVAKEAKKKSSKRKERIIG